MKNKGLIYTLIVFFSCLTIALIVLLILLLKGNVRLGNFNFSNTESSELILEKEYDSDFENIDIDIELGNVYIKNSSDDTTKVIIYGDKDRLEYNDKENLDIKYKGRVCVGICFNNEQPKIEIYLSEDALSKVDIDNKYGDVRVDSFNNLALDLKLSYGDIEIDKVNTLEVDSAYGDIDVDEAKEINSSNDYGNVKVGKITSYFNMENDCGDIKIDEVILDKNSSIKASLGNIKIGKTNELYIDAHTSLGDVKVNENNNKSDITLKIENSCGDIKVN